MVACSGEPTVDHVTPHSHAHPTECLAVADPAEGQWGLQTPPLPLLNTGIELATSSRPCVCPSTGVRIHGSEVDVNVSTERIKELLIKLRMLSHHEA